MEMQTTDRRVVYPPHTKWSNGSIGRCELAKRRQYPEDIVWRKKPGHQLSTLHVRDREFVVNGVPGFHA